MKFLLLIALLLSSLTSRPAAADLPEHFTGIGMFTWRETLGNPTALAQIASRNNVAYVVVKSHDGINWGTRQDEQWVPSLTRGIVAEFHHKNIRVYAYFTARLTGKRAAILAQIALADRALDLGVDGLVADDLFLFGTSREKAELYFSELKRRVDGHAGTVLAFSAFPHLMRNFNQPWDIAMKYSRYFLTQSYWRLFRQGNRPRMTPENSLAYTQANWDALRAYFPGHNCTLIPVGQSYGSATPEQIDRFLTRAYPFYRSVAFFRWGTMPTGGWDKIKVWGGKYVAARQIQDPSLIGQFNPPPASKPPIIKPKPIKPKPEKPHKPVPQKKRG